jgi:hypothetical protein
MRSIKMRHEKQKERSAAKKNTKVAAQTQAYNSRYMLRPEDRPWPLKVLFVLFSGTLPAFEGSCLVGLNTRPPSRAYRRQRHVTANVAGNKFKQ